MAAETSQEELVADLLAQLVKQMLPTDAPQRTRDLSFRRASALVASAIGRGAQQLASDRGTDRIAADIRRTLLLSSGGDSSRALAFGELFARLTSSPLLRRPAAVLSLLHALADPSQQQQRAKVQHPPPRVAGDITAPSVLEGVIPEKLRPALVVPSTTTKASTVAATPQQQQRVGNLDEESAALVRDVVHSLQGVETQRVHVASASAADVVVPVTAPALPRAQRDLAARIAEAGWLYRRVASAAADPAVGAAALALATALRAELCEFDRLVAVLAAQLDATNAAERLTLHRLLVLVDEPTRRLTLLATLADAVRSSGAVGGALAKVVHLFSRHGDPLVRETVDRLTSRVARPLHEMAVRWMCDGVLDDPHGEFFVGTDTTVPSDAVWQARFGLREAMLPPYISEALARRILLVGKTVAFIRGQCGDAQWQIDPAIVAALSERGIEYGRPEALASAVFRAAESAGKRLLELVRDKFALLRHVTAIKRFLLLCQGDFAQALVEVLAHDLSQPSVTLMRHSLMPALETALHASCAQFDPHDVTDRLDISLPESSPEKSGWDTFSLAYIVDGPTTAVLTTAAMEGYASLFRTLWQLKRAEHELARTWQLQSIAGRVLGRSTVLAPGDILLCCSIRSVAEHIVSSVRHFVMDDVLEPEWNAFSEAVSVRAKCLDDVIAAHTKFLASVSERALITLPFSSGSKKASAAAAAKKPSSKARQLFHQLLSLSLAFCSLQETFLTSALQEESRKARLREDMEIDGGAEEEELLEEEDAETEFSVQLPAVRQRLQSFSSEMHTVQSQFLAELTTHAAKDPSVRTLMLRLDFNGFYSQR